jgi:cytosine/adenosine deaminase-related metal-dependent hydrolase
VYRFISGICFDGYTIQHDIKTLVFDETGILRDIIPPHQVDPLKTEHASGLLTPGFINAHTHLELSHLYGLIPQHTGLATFAVEVVKNRGQASPDDILQAMHNADRNMYEQGIVAVGDICNTDVSIAVKRQSALFYHSFIECIGIQDNRSIAVLNNHLTVMQQFQNAGLHSSLAAHAPYSCAYNLVTDILKYNHRTKQPFSLHVLESSAEDDFLKGNASEFNTLYHKLDINYTPPVNASNSLNSWMQQIYSSVVPCLLVHNVFADAAWYANKNSNLFWVFCPKANQYIQNTLPVLLPDKNWITATDSLASNTTLDLILELNVLYRFHKCSIDAALQSITSTPAKALQIQHRFGSLQPGTACGLNEIEISPSGLTFVKRWIH